MAGYKTKALSAPRAKDIELEKRMLFQEKMDSVKNELYSFAYRLMGNREDAEDLLQESYFKAYKYFNQLRNPSKFKEWVFQITANQFRNQIKKKKRERTYFVDDVSIINEKPQEKTMNPDNIFEGVDLSDKVRNAIDNLHPKMKTALVLFELQEFNIEEVAGILNISPGTVKSRLHYARKRLKTELLKTKHGRQWEKDFKGGINKA
ncbi:RNA polymerase sigma factor [bacterium]|nr:RNA polymerase sigma factor [bacterium]